MLERIAKLGLLGWFGVTALECESHPRVVGPAPEASAGASAGTGAFGGSGGFGGIAGAAAAVGNAGASGAHGGEPVPARPELVFPSLQLPNASGVTDFAFVPGSDDELLVLEHRGTVIHYRLDAGSSISELGRTTISDLFFDEGCGLLSLVFDPEFEDNRFLYISRCQRQTVSRIARFEFDSIEGLPATEVAILDVEAPLAEEDWHRFGSMGFEPDGKTMWALMGDSFVRQLAQDASHKAGSLLRIVPNRDPNAAGYTPAAGNAFSDPLDGDPSIYARGFRSPWRGTLDRFGRFWVGDVGLITREEVNLVERPGQNFGWDRYEGACASDCEGLTNPLTAYGRASDEPYVIDDPATEPATKRAVWVGQAYHSDQDRYHGLFDDSVMFGDFFTGWVRRLEVDPSGALVSDTLVGHLTQVTSWKTGPDGFMYVLTLPGGLHRATQVLN